MRTCQSPLPRILGVRTPISGPLRGHHLESLCPPHASPGKRGTHSNNRPGHPFPKHLKHIQTNTPHGEWPSAAPPPTGGHPRGGPDCGPPCLGGPILDTEGHFVFFNTLRHSCLSLWLLKHTDALGSRKYQKYADICYSSGSQISVNMRANNPREKQKVTSGYQESG